MVESCRTVHCAVWRILPGVDVVRHYWSDRRPRHLRRFRARESSSVPALCVFVGRFCGRDADLANLVRAMSMKSAGAPRRSSRGLDVSVKETSLCIVDEAGRICREVKVVSHPEDLLAVLCDPAWRLERVGLEAGPLSQWLFSGLAEAAEPERIA